MDQLTTFGKLLLIVMGLAALGLVLYTLYRVIVEPVVATVQQFHAQITWGIAITGILLWVALLAYVYTRLHASARYHARAHGRPIYEKVEKGRQFVGWVDTDEAFQPRHIPALANLQQLSLGTGRRGSQASPYELLAEGKLEEEEAREDAIDAMIPARGSWESVKSGVRGGHIFLGWTLEGELWTSFEEILSMYCSGQQGFGKTGLARLLALQAKLCGLHVVIWDSFNDISGEAQPFFTPHCHSDARDIEDSAELLWRVIARRRDEWATGRRDFPEVLVVVDEWMGLEESCPMARKVLGLLLNEGRKIGFRFYIASVRLSAKALEGAFNKSAASATFVFACEADLAASLGVKGDLGAAAHKAMLRAGKGYCVLHSVRLAGRMGGLDTVLALPDITPDLFRAELRRLRHSGAVIALEEEGNALEEGPLPPLPPVPPLPMKQETSQSVPPILSSPSLTDEGGIALQRGKTGEMRRIGKDKIRWSETERREVIRLHYEEGLAAFRIPKRMGKSGAWYYEVRDILDEEEARREAAEEAGEEATHGSA